MAITVTIKKMPIAVSGHLLLTRSDRRSGVSIGQEKLLLVLGLPVDEWKFDRPLSHQDVRVLHLSMASCWKAAAIGRVLRQVAQQVKVAYCVSDQGNNLKAALKALAWPHLYDCAHQWAHLLKQCYEKAPDFTELFKQTARLRKAWALSEHCHLIPPSMRSKARFLNIFPLVNWMEKIRAHWDELSAKAQQELAFLQTHYELIDELICLKEVIGQMAALLKVKGMNLASLQTCSQLLESCQQGRPLAFKTKLLAAWQAYHPWLSEKSLLCSSDIIESYFGRYKLRLQANGMQTLTDSVLMMGGWSYPLTQNNVETALTQVKMKDIEDWKKENIVPSLLKKRKAFFTKKYPKNAPDV